MHRDWPADGGRTRLRNETDDGGDGGGGEGLLLNVHGKSAKKSTTLFDLFPREKSPIKFISPL